MLEEVPGKNTRVGCHLFLQGIFLTQGLNLCLLLGRQILYRSRGCSGGLRTTGKGTGTAWSREPSIPPSVGTFSELPNLAVAERPTMHGGGSAPSCCAFTHRVAFEEGSGPGWGALRMCQQRAEYVVPCSKQSQFSDLWPAALHCTH